MNQHTAPIGTVATIGHPANNILIRKYDHDEWRYMHSGEPVSDEEFRGGWDVAPQPPPFESGYGRPDLGQLHNLLHLIDMGEPVNVLRATLVNYLTAREESRTRRDASGVTRDA